MAINLSGPREKVKRAYEHRYRLNAVVNSAGETEFNQIQLRAELERKTSDYIFSVAAIPEGLRLKVGVIVGDVVHNLRSALDHLFWELYCHRIGIPQTRDERRNVQFPIEDRGEGFRKKRKRFSKIPHSEWAIIDAAQPYKRRNRKRTLGLLRNLSNRDKHQVLTPILTRPTITTLKGGVFEGTGALKWAKMLPPKQKNLKVNTKLMRVSNLSPDYGFKVEVAGYITPYVMLPERRDITIVPVIDEMIACVEGVVNSFP